MKLTKLEEFLKTLSETSRTWTLRPDGLIRDDSGRCPIEAVLDELPDDFQQSRFMGRSVSLQERLGLKLYNGIIGAADMGPIHDSLLRQQLLEACGIEESVNRDAGHEEATERSAQ